jgi:hypothetical protein
MSEDKGFLRREFWKQLLRKSEQKGFLLFVGVKPSKYEYLISIIGEKKNRNDSIGYEYALLDRCSRVQLRINLRNPEENKERFDTLYSNREQIEKAFGKTLCWSKNGLEEKEGTNYSLISYVVAEKGLKDKEQWARIQDDMINEMTKFEKAFSKYL